MQKSSCKAGFNNSHDADDDQCFQFRIQSLAEKKKIRKNAYV